MGAGVHVIDGMAMLSEFFSVNVQLGPLSSGAGNPEKRKLQLLFRKII